MINNVRLMMPFISLILYSKYFYINLNNIEVSGGDGYLGMFFVLAFLSAFLSKEISLKYINRSSFFVFLFIFYHIFAWAIGTQDLSVVHAYVLGTSQGVVLALLEGLGFSLIFSEIFFQISISQTKRKTFIKFLVLSVLVLFYYIDSAVLIDHMKNVRLDIFLIDNVNANYQRPGQFMTINYLVSCAIFILLEISDKKNKGWINIIAFFFIILISFKLGLLSQLLGSNSSLFSVLCVFAGVVLYFACSIKSFEKVRGKISFAKLFFRKQNTKCFFLIFTIGCGIYFYSSLLTFDFEKYRAFGYGAGNNSSVLSRIELFKNNFIEHFSYAPILGDVMVDSKLTGTGTYIHSLLSVLTHLGIVGSILFITMTLNIHSEIKKKIERNINPEVLFLNSNYGIYRLIMIYTIGFICLLTALYTWMPFWFAIGLFGITLSSNEIKLRCNQSE